jgi:hypothetical protein
VQLPITIVVFILIVVFLALHSTPCKALGKHLNFCFPCAGHGRFQKHEAVVFILIILFRYIFIMIVFFCLSFIRKLVVKCCTFFVLFCFLFLFFGVSRVVF